VAGRGRDRDQQRERQREHVGDDDDGAGHAAMLIDPSARGAGRVARGGTPSLNSVPRV